MTTFILEYWLEVVFSLIVVLGGVVFRVLCKQLRAEVAKQDATSKGVQALLRDRLIQAYYYYQGRGYITLHGLENIDSMFSEYKHLGGNGTVEKIMKDLYELEVKAGSKGE